jgi:ribosomal-protein-alanine N-acetyltransferase
MGYVIRRMQDRDIPQAIEIDREAFPNQWPHPSYSSFKQELRNRLACYIVTSKQKETEPESTKQSTNNKSFWQKLLGLKHLFDDDRFFSQERLPPPKDYVVGIAGFWVMADEAHITTIAVRDAYRRRGIGEWLLTSIIDMAATQFKANVVTLEVRISNKQAQTLYQKYGFQKVGLRRAYYTDNGEDALLMTTDTLTSATFQSHFQQLKQAHQHRWRKLYSNETQRVV